MPRGASLTLGAALVVVVGATPAVAGEAPPFLTTSDFLPDVVVQVDTAPVFSDVSNQFVLDPDACTQTIEPDDTVLGQYSVQFAEEATNTTVLLQTVVDYGDDATARAAFQRHKSTAKGGVKCGTVENLIEGSSSVDYEKVKVPKVGDGSYGIGRGFEGGEPAIAVELLSEQYVCILQTYGNDSSPTLKDLKALVKAAEKQLISGG